jgi:cell wall-associated NlpC family hydrolase
LSPAAVAAADLAQSLVGAPYRNGGQDPDGFDCSGFVQYVFTQSGIGMPRSVREQFEVGQNIDPADVRPGDLVFFAIDGHRVSHVGIVVGDDAFVHAPSSRGQVRIDRLSMEYWRTRLAAAKRPT